MLQFCVLGSGSSGNATLVTDGTTTILIDAGLSFKQLTVRAEKAGWAIHDVQAVFITHEHSDHVNGLGVLSRKLRVPVYCTRSTHHAMPNSLGEMPTPFYFQSGDTIRIGDLTIASYGISHDAALRQVLAKVR